MTQRSRELCVFIHMITQMLQYVNIDLDYDMHTHLVETIDTHLVETYKTYDDMNDTCDTRRDDSW